MVYSPLNPTLELASHNVSASQKANDSWKTGANRVNHEENLYTSKEEWVSTGKQ